MRKEAPVEVFRCQACEKSSGGAFLLPSMRKEAPVEVFRCHACEKSSGGAFLPTRLFHEQRKLMNQAADLSGHRFHPFLRAAPILPGDSFGF